MRIAHRGGGGWRPENTMAAFRHAIASGCDAAELDVQLTGDGALVVHHDLKLNPQLCRRRDSAWLGAGESIPIATSTLADLRRFEVGVPNPECDYATRFDRMMPVPGEPIPTLDEVITLAKESSETFQLVIEVKTRFADAADEAWRPLVAAIANLLRERGFIHRAILCGFDWGSMIHAKTLVPDLRTWFTTHTLHHARYSELMHRFAGDPRLDWPPRLREQRFPEDTARWIRELGGDAWFMHHQDCTAGRVHQIHDAGLLAAVWSVNLKDGEEIQRLAGTGVDAICSDYP